MSIYLCPADRKLACSWEGHAEDILDHFQQEHDLLLYFDNSFSIDLKEDSENRLFFIDEEIYLLQTKISNNLLVMQLRYLGPTTLANKINYNIEIRINGVRYRNNIIVNSQGGIEVDLESLRHFEGDVETLSGTLNVTKQFSNFPFSFDEGITFGVDQKVGERNLPLNLPKSENISTPEAILEEVNLPVTIEKNIQYAEDVCRHDGKTAKKCCRSNTVSSEIMMSRTSVKRTKSTISLGSIPESNISTSDCSNCGRFLIPPIYLCPCNNNFCYDCRATNCKYCFGQVTSERNIELEEKYKKFLFPCKNQRLGCPDKILYDNLLHHEINCTFCMYRCPSEGCQFEAQFKGMVKHLKLIHGSIKIFESFIVAFQNISDAFIVNEERGIFFCCVKYTNDFVTWEVKFAGPKERKFFCELKFKEGRHEPYLLAKQDNVYSIRMNLQDLKKRKLKPKNAIVAITC